ncbi:MAG: DM13 domain-containing protein [Actinobacteria bacterium]|nr:DM13 domain-containing protein [Actinomycetota bacterium]
MGRLLPALPAVAFLATFGFFFVDKNREARTVLKSGRGLFTVAAIIVGYLAIAFVLRRFVRWAWAAPVVLTAVVVALAAWIVRPYYVDETADRQLVAGPVQDASEVTAPATSQDQPPQSQAPAAGPVRISSGAIRGLGHDASGTISIIRSPDGSSVARFENFDIEGTPDPRVYLVQGDDVRAPGGIELGRLQGNVGQVLDYAVPDTEAGPGWTVLVWCRSFSVPIANATQTPA